MKQTHADRIANGCCNFQSVKVSQIWMYCMLCCFSNYALIDYKVYLFKQTGWHLYSAWFLKILFNLIMKIISQSYSEKLDNLLRAYWITSSHLLALKSAISLKFPLVLDSWKEKFCSLSDWLGSYFRGAMSWTLTELYACQLFGPPVSWRARQNGQCCLSL